MTGVGVHRVENGPSSKHDAMQRATQPSGRKLCLQGADDGGRSDHAEKSSVRTTERPRWQLWSLSHAY